MADFASASLIENVRFNQAVIVPNALQGLFKRRRRAVDAATRINVDGQAIGLLQGLRRSHGSRPLWVRVVRDRGLLLLDVKDVRRALEGSPHPFASDPEAKRKGMSHWQPDALTISRGDLWKERREFTDAVLGKAVKTLGERFEAVIDEEVGAAVDTARGTSELFTYEDLHRAYRRATRRIVLGESAADDEEVTLLLGELMGQANGLPSERSEEFAPFRERIAAYYEKGERGSLAGLALKAKPAPDVRADGQIPHWLFATQDTLSANVMRALALVASGAPVDEDAAARATLQEAMRLWPTTPLLSRETVADVVWENVRVPARTNVLIVNVFHHRDPERLGDAADRFTPQGWSDGTFAEDWGLNHFSHGPQGCPGANLALTLGTATLQAVARRATPVLQDKQLDISGKLPHMLDVFSLKFAL